MSFDLYVWYESAPITAGQALEKIMIRGEGEKPSPFAPHPSLSGFRAALLDRFPELEELEEEDIEEHAAWSGPVEASDSFLELTIRWSQVERVSPVVQGLAADYGLVCYDPQNEIVLPNAPGYEPAFTLTSQSYPAVPDPDEHRIERAVSRLGRDNYFVILERADGWYVQAGYGESAGVRAGTYAIEYREGSPERHSRAETTDISAVLRLMQEFRRGDDTWKRRHVLRQL